MPGWFPKNQWASLPQRVGFIPAFPVPTGTNQSSTMMGGWELAIPQTSKNKDLAWELLTIMGRFQDNQSMAGTKWISSNPEESRVWSAIGST